jgi:hypothetical protein
MHNFKPGQEVNVPCNIQPGAFADERLITIHTDKGDISGFVKIAHLTDPHSTAGYVRGRVIEVGGDAVKVRLPGSFFTTALGVASVSASWAKENLASLAA